MKIIKLKNNSITTKELTIISNILEKGGLVVLPTDTSYMLAANALDSGALEKLFLAKNRNFSQPVSLCFPDIKMAMQYAYFTPLAKRVAAKFLPGALTIVLPSKILFSAMVVKNGKIGIRIPATRVTLEIVRKFGRKRQDALK